MIFFCDQGELPKHITRSQFGDCGCRRFGDVAMSSPSLGVSQVKKRSFVLCNATGRKSVERLLSPLLVVCRCEKFQALPSSLFKVRTLSAHSGSCQLELGRNLAKALEIFCVCACLFHCTYIRIYIYDLESRWRNSHALVYHGPLPIHRLGVAPSTFTTVCIYILTYLYTHIFMYPVSILL